MEEQIFKLFKESITHEYFTPALIIVVIFVIIKSMINYKEYIKTCKIFQQEPKTNGYIGNSLINILGMILITTIGFTGYTALTQAGTFEERYMSKINKEEKTQNEHIVPIINNTINESNHENIKLRKEVARLNKIISQKRIIKKEENKQIKPFVKLVTTTKDGEIKNLQKENHMLNEMIDTKRQNVNNVKKNNNSLAMIQKEKNRLQREVNRLEKNMKILIKKYDKCSEKRGY